MAERRITIMIERLQDENRTHWARLVQKVDLCSETFDGLQGVDLPIGEPIEVYNESRIYEHVDNKGRLLVATNTYDNLRKSHHSSRAGRNLLMCSNWLLDVQSVLSEFHDGCVMSAYLRNKKQNNAE